MNHSRNELLLTSSSEREKLVKLKRDRLIVIDECL